MSATKKSSFFRKDSAERTADAPAKPTIRKPKADWVNNDEPKADRPAVSKPRSAGPRTEKPRTTGPRTAGPRTERPKTEWTKSDKPRTAGPRTEKPRTEWTKSDKPRSAGPRTEKPKTERARISRPKPESPLQLAPVKVKQVKAKQSKGVMSEVSVRLNRFIAQSGVCSRREADAIIESGAITVNDTVVVELGTKINPQVDIVKHEGKPLRGEKLVYIIMNKPKGYVTSLDDPHNEDTVITLLKGQVKERVYPVGRLDKNTTGVLLLTNDGDLTTRLTHPSYERSKIYHVFLDKPCSEEDVERIAKGFELEDGEIHADEVSFVEGNRKEVGIEIHSGRNRIVRRIFEHLDYKVIKLDRVFFAGLTKMGLRRGFWRYLSPKEIMTLKNDN